MGKKKVERPQHELTRHQLTRWEQQKKRQRLFLILGISIIAVVGGTVGRGWYTKQYQPMRETVIRVNDTEFNMAYYIDMFKVYTRDQPAEYVQYLAGRVTKLIEQSELIKQGAAKLGIVVSDSEIEDRLKEYGLPSSEGYREAVGSDILLDKLKDEYFDKQVSTSAEQRHIMAMFLESQPQASGVRAKLEGGEDFGELAEELSLDNISQDKGGDLGWHPKGILSEMLDTTIVDDYAFSADVGALSQPLNDKDKIKRVGYWLVKLLDKDEPDEAESEEGEQYRIKVMLLGSEAEAQEVRAKLEGGEDFEKLAKELSQDSASKAKGGDLDWIGINELIDPAKDFVADAELGSLSEPIEDDTITTQGGYWLVKVLDKDDNRQLSDDDRDTLKAQLLDDWVTSLWDNPDNKIESYLDEDKVAWAIDKVTSS
ncbi:MAG: peptidylprolyl isomerase [Dehalococcoidales bacterium]|nr:peptidylprolyl isomerase [Dehalococcoidales bacterium]